MTAHHVYVCRQADGRALYVGCSRVLFERLEAHRRRSFWAHLVVRVEAKVYASKEAGLAAERAAIRVENPRYNVVGRWQHRLGWASADYRDYLEALLSRPNTAWKSEHIDHVLHEQALRQRIAQVPA